LFKPFSAWLPIVMSGFALILVVMQGFTAGETREVDEGAAAHLWQLLMVGQVPFICWFLFRWVTKNPRRNAVVFAVQIVAFLVAVAPVFLLGF
jgi:ammonia channel protein AmtB